MDKSSLVLNYETGFWEKDEESQPFVAEIRPDKCLCSKPIRSTVFKAHALVAYDPKSFLVERNDSGEDIFLIKVVPAEGNGHTPILTPLCMLNLNKAQQEHLNKKCRVPKKAFPKRAVALHTEIISPEAEINEEQLVDIDEELLAQTQDQTVFNF